MPYLVLIVIHSAVPQEKLDALLMTKQAALAVSKGWAVLSHLGSGAFGDTFVCTDLIKLFALKFTNVVPNMTPDAKRAMVRREVGNVRFLLNQEHKWPGVVEFMETGYMDIRNHRAGCYVQMEL